MRLIAMLSLFAASSVGAQEPPAPAAPTCDPPCRKGYFCRDGECVSECNPLCPSGQICRDRECIADPNAPRVSAQPTPGENTRRSKDEDLPYNSFVGLGGGVRATIKGAGAADLPSASFVGIDTGSRYLGGGIALAFPDGGIVVVTEFIRVQFPFNLASRWFMEPQFGIGFNYGSFDNFAFQEIALVPGLRVRYDLTRAFALYLQAVRFEFAVYTAVDHSNPALDGRVDETLINASTSAGVQVRY